MSDMSEPMVPESGSLKWQAEVARLTAELAEMKGFEIPLRDARIDELSDIEKALRAITGEMCDGWGEYHGEVQWVLDEWDRRADRIV